MAIFSKEKTAITFSLRPICCACRLGFSWIVQFPKYPKVLTLFCHKDRARISSLVNMLSTLKMSVRDVVISYLLLLAFYELTTRHIFDLS